MKTFFGEELASKLVQESILKPGPALYTFNFEGFSESVKHTIAQYIEHMYFVNNTQHQDPLAWLCQST